MGNTLFTAGHLPVPADGSGPILGKVGQDLSTDEGYEAARHVAINMIATLKHELGDLDKVDDLVKVSEVAARSRVNFVALSAAVRLCVDPL